MSGEDPHGLLPAHEESPDSPTGLRWGMLYHEKRHHNNAMEMGDVQLARAE